MIVTIVGIGLIGGSFAKDLRRVGFASEVIGVDASSDNLSRAIELGIIDYALELEEGVKKADLVIVATPVDVIEKILPEILNYVSPTTTVVDTGSTKAKIVMAVENHINRQNFVPSHPMSGTENSGPDAALDGLFENKITIICDQEKSKPIHVAMVEKMYQAVGMGIAYMTDDEQDHSTAHLSHLPHITAFALANTVLAKNDRGLIFDLASGGFRSTVRLAKSSPQMWGPIFKQNQKYIVESLDDYIFHLKEFRNSMVDEDESKMYDLMYNANRIRHTLDGSNNQMQKKEEQHIKLFTK